jgi:transcriptional regulator of acetoin/glycerol metabolism
MNAALQATGGNKLAAARLLGISRATLVQPLENPV